MCERLGVIGNDINHTELEVLFVQQKILVLGMDIDELFTKFFQYNKLNRRIVDEGPTFSCTRQFAADDTVRGIVFYIILGKESFHTIA